MDRLHISLFGTFTARQGDHVIALESGKVQELFLYLLLHRHRPGPRETLASVLWPFTTTAQSKAYLRRALWQLRSGIEAQLDLSMPAVVASADWIQFNPDLDYWLDVDEFERAYERVDGVAGRDMSRQDAEILRGAVALYGGDLLECYYQEWCLYERERFRHYVLVMLDKLASYFEAQQQYEAAISYAERILGYDRARERTHRQLMRLRDLSGDRTGGIHQYEDCVRALREEMDLLPSESTVRLYEQIRVGRTEPPLPGSTPRSGASGPSASNGPSPVTHHDPANPSSMLLAQLKKAVAGLTAVERLLRNEVHTLGALVHRSSENGAPAGSSGKD